MNDISFAAGRKHLVMTWVVACLPWLVFMFNFRPSAHYRWLWRVLTTLTWLSPVVTLICAVVLTYREVTTTKNILGWMGVGIALYVSFVSTHIEGP